MSHPSPDTKSLDNPELLMLTMNQPGISKVENEILNLQNVLQTTPDSNPKKHEYLDSLADAFYRRFKLLGNLKDLEDAMSNQKKGILITPDQDPKKSIYFAHYKNLNTLKGLEDKLLELQKKLQATPDSDLTKKRQDFDNLADVLYKRFQHIGNIQDLDDAISNQQKGLEITPDQDPDKPIYLRNLAVLLLDRFEQSGTPEHLKNAINSIKERIRIYTDLYSNRPDNDGNLAAAYGSLGAAFLMRFQHLGTFEDLEDAISNLKEALKRLPDDLNAQRRRIKSGFLTNLGIAFQGRFERLDPPIKTAEALEDIRKGVEKARERVDQASKKDPKDLTDGDDEAPGDLQTAEYTLKHLETAEAKALDDLEMAISTQREAAEILQDGDEDKPERLSNLGSALLERFWRLKRPEDLTNAISYHQQAVDLTSDEDPNKPISLNSLAVALKGRSDIENNPKYLESAISNLNKAILLTKDNDPNKTNRLLNLSIALQERFERLKDQANLGDALSNAEQAAKHPSGSPRARFFAALQWAKCADSSSVSPLPAYQLAINLLPRIAWIGIPFTDQRAQLEDVGGAVHDAVAAAIRHEQYETAVEWTEHGRSIVWQNLVGLRAPLDDLRIKYPGLADKFEDISRRLRRLSPGDKSLNGRQATSIVDISTYSSLAIEYDNLLDTVRRIPGLERFLHPKTFSELAPAASEGPVVILNDHASRADALVLLPKNSSTTTASLMNIHLEEFASNTSKKHFVELNRLLLEARLRTPKYRLFQNPRDVHNAEFKAILRELWLHVVKPVIDRLGYKANPEHPPRIWWCATGSFAFLPIHAAGLYDSGTAGDNLTDYAVSSYTPTLSSLLDQSSPDNLEGFRILAVAEESKIAPLPGTKDDVEAVRVAAGAPSVHLLVNEDATIERVLQGMKESHWVHLSCHGKQDAMKSGFLLHGDKMLELSEIIQQDLPKAQFAYLSACETAMGDETLAEESIHLAAGMLIAGYRGVIGSMWEIGDNTAPEVTKEVYTSIMKEGKPNRKGAALALQNATKRLVAYGYDCVQWLPFIHIGR